MPVAAGINCNKSRDLITPSISMSGANPVLNGLRKQRRWRMSATFKDRKDCPPKGRSEKRLSIESRRVRREKNENRWGENNEQRN
jgi:hypothetical protein